VLNISNLSIDGVLPFLRAANHFRTFMHGKMNVLAACLVFCAAVHVVSAQAAVSLPTCDDGEPVSNTAVDQAIRLAADYTKRNCGANGKFVYQINVKSHRESSRYDPIRHAGAITGLAMYSKRHAGDLLDRATEGYGRCQRWML
jgi:hypothetical protein